MASMSNRSRALVVTALFSAAIACSPARQSSASFRLPEDGNAERGKQAFLAMGCAECHTVPGETLSPPLVKPGLPVILGGVVNKKLSDAYLVTAIINPKHEFAKSKITTAGMSRMPSYADRLTVRQMVDIVAFLQAHYDVRPAMPEYSYYR